MYMYVVTRNIRRYGSESRICGRSEACFLLVESIVASFRVKPRPLERRQNIRKTGHGSMCTLPESGTLQLPALNGLSKD